MSTKFCSNCGKHVPLDSNFCTSCGQQVSAAQSEQPVQSQTYQDTTNTTVNVPKNSNNNKWFLIGAVAVIAIIAFFMFNKDATPEKVAEDFVEYMSNFEFGKAKDLLARDVDEGLKEDIDWMLKEIKEDPDLLDEQKEYAKESGYKLKSFKVTDIDEEEDYAYVYVEITYVNGETEDIDVDLLKENGKWKVEDTY